jgi:hypothetical protein
LLLLTLWSALAHAGMDEDGVAATIRDLQDASRTRILLGAIGPEAEKALQRIVAADESLDVVLVRIPPTDDLSRELWKALNKTGLICALQVKPDAGRTWSVTPFGNCLPSQALPTPDFDADADPMVVTVSVPAAQDAQRYMDQRLELSLEPRIRDAWSIADGEGVRLSATSFASLVGDDETTAQLLQEQKRALTTTSALRVGGAAVSVGAIVPLINMPDGSSAREDRLWTSLFLLSTGLLAVTIAPRTIDAINERQDRPDNYYDQKQADAWITTFNTGLQQDLGLTSEPTAEPEPEVAPEPEPSALPAVEESP